MIAFGPTLPGLAGHVAPARWVEGTKGSRVLVALADRHYTRQKPGDVQCCRPGVNLVLVLSDATAAWVVWRPIPEVGRMDHLEAWECTFFRNEGTTLSSSLIIDATAKTYRAWGWPPRDGLITSIGIEETRRRRSKRAPPGACFAHAGWTPQAERGGKAWLRAPHPERKAADTPAGETGGAVRNRRRRMRRRRVLQEDRQCGAGQRAVRERRALTS